MPRILVVDDSPSALQIAQKILEDAGFQVAAFTSGKLGMEALGRERFDLIVTDIYMPDEDGLDVIRYSRRFRPDVPVVAVSGMSGHRSMLGVAKQLGACRVLQKPYSKADLLDIVAAALGTARSAGPAGR